MAKVKRFNTINIRAIEQCNLLSGVLSHLMRLLEIIEALENFGL